jgi:hypothetical protein
MNTSTIADIFAASIMVLWPMVFVTIVALVAEAVSYVASKLN